MELELVKPELDMSELVAPELRGVARAGVKGVARAGLLAVGLGDNGAGLLAAWRFHLCSV